MEPDDLEGPDQISRRRMLRNIGVGTAVAWTAPTVLSLGGRAVAQTTSPVCPGDDFICGDTPVVCGDSGPFELCLCDVNSEGQPFCLEDHFCPNLDPCTADADCPASWACAEGCCDTPVCVPPCGERFSGAATEGTRFGGAAS